MKKNKNLLIDEIAKELKLPVSVVKKVINLFLFKIEDSLIKGYKVLIKGFGTFFAKEAKPRKVNDFKGGKIQVGPRLLPKITFSDSIVNKIKNK